MASNSDEIVQQVPDEFQNLLADVTGPDARVQTAYTVELSLFRRVLALGAALLRLFVVTRAAVRPAEPVATPDGTRLTAHDQRPTTSFSGLGKVRFGRQAFTAPGQQGLCPLDAELSVPARGDADLLQEWAIDGTTDESSRESPTVLERILGWSRRAQAIATSVADAAGEVSTCYEPPAEPPAPAPEPTMLVVQAAGTGVPMVPASPAGPSVRLSTGQKRGNKQEAVVTGLYTIAPYRRTPHEVVAALLPDPGGPEAEPRPTPVGKALRATLEGKSVAMARRVRRVEHREGPQIQHRVARTEGAEALQQQVVIHVPEHTLVLDSIHATEYLWDTAHLRLGETHPHRTVWVRSDLEPLVAGQTEAVLAALEAEADDPTYTATQRRAVRRTVGYDRRNRSYMHDDEYLAQGWPIGTGVIEGACGHLGKDRLEQSGMRWTKTGAQAVLDRRAVRINGPWDRYGPFHRPQPHQRLYHSAVPVPEQAESQRLERAA
jgi:hypothetical protein